MFWDFLTPFISVGLAELGDKTQLALIFLAAETKNKWKLLVGAIMAFLVVDGLAVVLGAVASTLIPHAAVKTASGLLFILFGILMLKSAEHQKPRVLAGNPLFSAFTLICVAEFGDKTQLATAAFASTRNPLIVLAAAMTALTLISAAAVYFGEKISGRLEPRKTSIIAGTIFITIGAATLLT